MIQANAPVMKGQGERVAGALSRSGWRALAARQSLTSHPFRCRGVVKAAHRQSEARPWRTRYPREIDVNREWETTISVHVLIAISPTIVNANGRPSPISGYSRTIKARISPHYLNPGRRTPNFQGSSNLPVPALQHPCQSVALASRIILQNHA